jgi:hypothetical protein
MTIEQAHYDAQPPDILLAVIDYVDSYQQSGVSNSPEQVAAALILQRALVEGAI